MKKHKNLNSKKEANSRLTPNLWAYVAVVALVIAGGISLVAPRSSDAAVLRAGNEYEHPGDTTLDDDLYVAARDVTIAGTTTGDILTAGASVTLRGDVGADIAAAGGTVHVEGTVGGDARLVGGEVYVEGTVTEDLLVFGGTIALSEDATVEGDVLIFGDYVVLEGTVRGSVEVRARVVELRGTIEGETTVHARESLTIQDGSSLAGSLNYRAPREAFITDQAQVNGQVSFTQTERDQPTAGEMTVVGFVLRFLMVFVAAALLLLLIPSWAHAGTNVARERTGTMLAWGFAAIVLTPIAGVLLLVTVLGFFPGVAVLALYTAGLALAQAMVPIFAALLLSQWFTKEATISYPYIALGALVLCLIGLVPVLGPLVLILLFVLMFGTLAVRLYEVLIPFRRSKVAHDKQTSTNKK